MPFEPKKITRVHILNAIKIVKEKRLKNETVYKSTGWDLIWDGEDYPPKELMRYAHELMNGEHIWPRSGGEPTNKYLKKFGFTIVDKRENLDRPIEFFTNEDLLFLKEWANKQYDGSDYQYEIGQDLKNGPWEKTKYWTEQVAKLVNFKSVIKKHWKNQGGYFTPYTWGKIYDETEWTKEVYFTLGIHDGGDGEPFLNIKFDYQFQNPSELTEEQILVCKDLIRKDSKGVLYEKNIDIIELEDYSWNRLLNETTLFINSSKNQYYTILHEIGVAGESNILDRRDSLSKGSRKRSDGKPTVGERTGGKFQIRKQHDQISKKLEAYLSSIKLESEEVTPEGLLGRRAIDIVYKKNSEYVYYEIKTYNKLKSCIREAIGQLLDYAHWNTEVLDRDLRLIIVSPHKPTTKLREYLNILQKKYKLPINYQQFDLGSNQLKERI